MLRDLLLFWLRRSDDDAFFVVMDAAKYMTNISRRHAAEYLLALNGSSREAEGGGDE